MNFYRKPNCKPKKYRQLIHWNIGLKNILTVLGEFLIRRKSVKCAICARDLRQALGVLFEDNIIKVTNHTLQKKIITAIFFKK
jgi:hypothetical protein